MVFSAISALDTVREAVGPDVDIIMENHAIIDAQGAVQLGRAAEKYNVMYFTGEREGMNAEKPNEVLLSVKKCTLLRTT